MPSASTLRQHVAQRNLQRQTFEANVPCSGYLENKMYFLKLYEAILFELDGVLVDELGDDLNVTASQERSRRR